MRRFIYLFPILFIATVCACTDNDSFSANKNNVLSFSTDTVKMDTVFSGVASSTYTFWIYNRSNDGININNIKLGRGNQTGFRLNVDGTYLSSTQGYQVNNLEIRKGDSIRVFAEVTSSANYKDKAQQLDDDVVITLESGVQQNVHLRAYSIDAYFINNGVIRSDSTIHTDKPIVVYGGLKVDSGAILTLAAGTKMFFHSGAGIHVYGTLLSKGEVANPVVMRGDRLDHMFDYLPYDGVSGQWAGLHFYNSSYGNELYNTDIHSAMNGVVCDSSNLEKTKLTLYNCIIHNCKGFGMESTNSVVDIENTQISNTLGDCVSLLGGSNVIFHCTLAQFYPFDADRGVALRFSNGKNGIVYPLYSMQVVNSIISGYADDEIMGESVDTTSTFSYRFDHCLICTPKVENKAMTNIIWESPDSTASQNKNFRKVDIDSLRYDFRLDSLSRAINAGNTEVYLEYDRNGIKRDAKPDIGCYEYLK